MISCISASTITDDESAISDYAAAAVNWASANGIVSALSGNTFAPQNSAARAQIAVALMNYVRNVRTETPEPTPGGEAKMLIAYFSATNNTEGIANHLDAILDADLYEITPEQPYTSADLNYGDSSTRATVEQNDPNARPAISGSVDNMEPYDVIFLGYPIWWGQAPKIISTFLESYNFAGKTIIPFCTSGSSGIGSSATNLHSLTNGATWLDGQRFSGSATVDTVRQRVDGLDLPTQKTTIEQGEDTMLTLSINGTTLTATLEDNSSAQALRELLADGPRTIQMSDYMSTEKVGPLGTSLPTNDVRTTTQAGDIILYQGNQIVIYYAPNTYTFTRPGRINDTSAETLRTLLGSGDVSVTLSLTD